MLQYTGGDKLYVPVTHIDMIQKYTGGDGAGGAFVSAMKTSLARVSDFTLTADIPGTLVADRYGEIVKEFREIFLR